MKLFLFLAGLALVSARAPHAPILTDYHELVGIPEAARIQKAEAAADFDGSRIVGGSAAGLGAHPYAAGLIVSGNLGTSMCGASLVTNTRAVTAAHCWRAGSFQGNSLVVVLGSTRLFSGGTRVTTNNVQMHGSYNQNTLTNDVAVISMSHVNYNNNIRNIELPSGLFLSMTYAGERAVAVGYGRTSDSGSANSNPDLRQTTITVIQNWECVNIYGPNTVISSTLCTDGSFRTGPCSGDSGGPLVYQFQSTRYLIGVTSFRWLRESHLLRQLDQSKDLRPPDTGKLIHSLKCISLFRVYSKFSFLSIYGISLSNIEINKYNISIMSFNYFRRFL